MINARAETVEEKDLSSTIFAKSLCFPNEWNEEKDKFMFSNKEK